MGDQPHAVKGVIASADFYPDDGDGTYIEITIQAPKSAHVYPGQVTITWEK